MTDHEPVNIMGVFAFPNPDRDNRMIRFIDSERKCQVFCAKKIE